MLFAGKTIKKRNARNAFDKNLIFASISIVLIVFTLIASFYIEGVRKIIFLHYTPIPPDSYREAIGTPRGDLLKYSKL
jgi:hypothetical protein